MFNTKSEASWKLWSPGDNDVSVQVDWLQQRYHSGERCILKLESIKFADGLGQGAQWG